MCFCIGMSEPDSGSDLFAAKTQATKTDGGWLVNGTKIWTTNAHNADYMIALFRTSPPTKENRRHGLTQFLVDMKTPGITIRPINQMTGQHEFNEVVFQDAFVPDDTCSARSTAPGSRRPASWPTSAAGPSASSRPSTCWSSWCARSGDKPDARGAEGLGRLVAQLHTLRRMSVSVAGMLQAGKEPVVEGSIVKDLGTIWEQELPHACASLPPSSRSERPTAPPSRSSCLRHHDRAQAHHPGRHHRSPARHHRPRPGIALNAGHRKTAVADAGDGACGACAGGGLARQSTTEEEVTLVKSCPLPRRRRQRHSVGIR